MHSPSEVTHQNRKSRAITFTLIKPPHDLRSQTNQRAGKRTTYITFKKCTSDLEFCVTYSCKWHVGRGHWEKSTWSCWTAARWRRKPGLRSQALSLPVHAAKSQREKSWWCVVPVNVIVLVVDVFLEKLCAFLCLWRESFLRSSSFVFFRTSSLSSRQFQVSKEVLIEDPSTRDLISVLIARSQLRSRHELK